MRALRALTHLAVPLLAACGDDAAGQQFANAGTGSLPSVYTATLCGGAFTP